MKTRIWLSAIHFDCLEGMLFLLTFLITAAAAAVELPALFSDHAVLARRTSVPVWGKAAPGEKVTVTLGRAMASAVTGKDGRWMVRLDLSKSPEGPFKLHVNDKTVNDVLVGEVWLCSGQSNMNFQLSRATGAKEAIAVTDRKMRYFDVPRKAVFSPSSETGGRWVTGEPSVNGTFSAVSFFFGRRLRSELNCPVGLIHASWGGVAISTWISKSAMAEIPEEVERQKTLLKKSQEYPQCADECLKRRVAWEKRYDRADTPVRNLPGKDAVWTWVPAMKHFNEKPGTVWFRYYFTLPAVPEKPMQLALWRQDNMMDCYVNGTLIGSISMAHAIQRVPFSPTIPVKLLKKGKNELLIRVFSPVGRPWIDDVICRIDKILLKTDQWEFCRERLLPPLTDNMRKEYPTHPGSAPGPERQGYTLYNGMIAPLKPFAFSGVIWYQGESDCNHPGLYRKLFPLLIRSWRSDFENPSLPFYYCQLPCFGSKQTEPPQTQCRADLRDAQDSALSLPHTGCAVLIDLGEAEDIHPLEKKIPGERLAALALTQTYGRKRVAQGPRFDNCRMENGSIRIRFRSVGSGLAARTLPAEYPLTLVQNKYARLEPHIPGTALQGFAVCGKDGKWRWTKAEICGKDSIVIHEKEVVALRYAWEENPTCNLYNREGFPAAPFQCKIQAVP